MKFEQMEFDFDSDRDDPLPCPVCGSRVHYGDSDLWDTWTASCPTSGCMVKVGKASVDVDWKDVPGTYHRLTKAWNEKVRRYLENHGKVQ